MVREVHNNRDQNVEALEVKIMRLSKTVYHSAEGLNSQVWDVLKNLHSTVNI